MLELPNFGHLTTFLSHASFVDDVMDKSYDNDKSDIEAPKPTSSLTLIILNGRLTLNRYAISMRR